MSFIALLSTAADAGVPYDKRAVLAAAIKQDKPLYDGAEQVCAAHLVQ